jgi:hypothetical protein
VTPLATSLLHLQLNKMFKNMFCILALFGLAAVLATFQNMVIFFLSNEAVFLVVCDPAMNEL